MQRILLAVAAFAFLAISGAAVAEETQAEGQERLLWEHAILIDNFRSYHEYLRFYPHGKHAVEARRRLHELTLRDRPYLIPLPPARRELDP
jgi:hypothetical protein